MNSADPPASGSSSSSRRQEMVLENPSADRREKPSYLGPLSRALSIGCSGAPRGRKGKAFGEPAGQPSKRRGCAWQVFTSPLVLGFSKSGRLVPLTNPWLLGQGQSQARPSLERSKAGLRSGGTLTLGPLKPSGQLKDQPLPEPQQSILNYWATDNQQPRRPAWKGRSGFGE